MRLLSSNLQAFLAIVKNGTVHGAAKEIRLTQTGVTQRIRALEKELRTTLFLRSRKGMQLTTEGESLLRYCKGAQELEGSVLAQILGPSKDKAIHVSIFGPTSVMNSRVPEQCENLYLKWPDLYLNIVVDDSSDRLNMVRSGKASLAIVSPEQIPREMDSKKLRPDKYVLVGSPKWKGRRLNDILEKERIIDFDESDTTTLNYLKKFDLISQTKRPRLFVNSNELLIKYFGLGIGFGTLTHEIAKPHLEKGDLILLNGGVAMEDPLALVWYPRPEMPKYFKEIIQSIR